MKQIARIYHLPIAIVLFSFALLQTVASVSSHTSALSSEPLSAPFLTFTVNTAADHDGTCDAADCTLREAINAANANPGSDNIQFAIGTGAQTINLTSALPSISGPVVIDGTTQPGFTAAPLIELNGTNAGAGANGLTLFSSGSTIRGLIINRFGADGISIQGSAHTIEGNYIGVTSAGNAAAGNDNGIFIAGANNQIGGTTTAARNVLSGNNGNGILIFGAGATGNQVRGNLIGLAASGSAVVANQSDGVSISDVSGNTIGGTVAGSRNIISGNSGNGVHIIGGSDPAGTSNNLIQGNYIGTDLAGNVDLGNDNAGVDIFDAAGNTVGGASVAARNVISGNLDGIRINSSGSSGNAVRGNFIGTKADGVSLLGNAQYGINIGFSAHNNLIGGTLAGEGNTIAFNNSAGVIINQSFGLASTANSIQGNSIFSNGALGIDLFPTGVTANDSGDGDSGANDLQNFPMLTSVIPMGGDLNIQGSLSSTASANFRLEFFYSPACDASGNGEGKVFIGSTNVTTNGSGSVTFNVSFTVAVPAGSFVTATATNASGSTSEFSSCLGLSNCGYTLSRQDQSFAANGGTGSVTVTTAAGCTWQAISNDNWITVTSGAMGNGNGTVNYTVASHTASTSRIGTITIANKTFTVLQGANFLDVPVGHPFYDHIGKLSARGITLGCGGGNYCPAALVTREQMAAFIIRALGEFNPPTPGSQRFDDVPPTNLFYNFIDRMAVLGITAGCSASPPLYCPAATVTREQMAAFIIRGLGEFNPPTPASQRFNDVPPSNPFYNFIDRMAVLQITLGCSLNPPLYCPSGSVTREQMAAFLVRAFNL